MSHPEPNGSPGPDDSRRRLADLDPDEPRWRAVELAQRGRMILDVAEADLLAAEAALGPFHPTSWYFRNALADARHSWDRLRAQYGGAALESALSEPPVAVLTLALPGVAPAATLVPIGGKTYRAERIDGPELAASLWRLTRIPSGDDGHYYLGRLRDGSLHCDCAEWAYRDGDSPHERLCKHLGALGALGWL